METQNTATASLDIQTLKLTFKGNATEYFKIWIVNLCLSVVTLGIYSAWAKVRKNKYLYGNLELAGNRFDYHADPINILKGRILMAILFFGYSFAGKISVAISFFFLILITVLTPWIIVRALMFALSNTSYRNIRFGFQKDYKQSYVTFFKSMAVYIFTLGLAFPYAHYLGSFFRFNRIRFGNRYLRFNAPALEFFKIYYFAGAVFFVLVLAEVFALKAVFGDLKLAMAFIFLGVYATLFVIFAFIKAALTNMTAKYSNYGDVRFKAHLSGVELLFIYLTNIIACACTLGLAIPWATIRAFKYRMERTMVLAPAGSLDNVVAEAQAGQNNAAADAAVDFWDIDLGI